MYMLQLIAASLRGDQSCVKKNRVLFLELNAPVSKSITYHIYWQIFQ